jgi:hypothetical protein
MEHKGFLAGLSSVVLGIGAFAAHESGVLWHTAEPALLAAKSAHDASHSLQDLREGTYVRSQAVELFCAASASLNTRGELPDDATDWREFVKGRVGITTDSKAYFGGKLSQLETAVDLEQRSPQAAARYAEACLAR